MSTILLNGIWNFVGTSPENDIIKLKAATNAFNAIHTDDFCSFEKNSICVFKESIKIIKIFIVQNAEKAEISEDFRRLS